MIDAIVELLDTADDWAHSINRAHTGTVNSILETGALLIRAKAALPHGEFSRMFVDSEKRVGKPSVDEPLPFGSGTARQLIAIAEHQGLSNGKHVYHLPSSWGTLYELTKLPDDIFTEKLEAGEINPRLQRKNVRQWMGRSTEKKTDGTKSQDASKPEPELGPPINGLQFARMAIADLEQIQDDDVQRDEAFAMVMNWITGRIKC